MSSCSPQPLGQWTGVINLKCIANTSISLPPAYELTRHFLYRQQTESPPDWGELGKGGNFSMAPAKAWGAAMLQLKSSI